MKIHKQLTDVKIDPNSVPKNIKITPVKLPMFTDSPKDGDDSKVTLR